MIGSLFWDKKKGRNKWRQEAFDVKNLENPVKVPLPLRYGRYSEGRKCPTMVLSNEYYKTGKLGRGLVIPFKGEELTVDQIIFHAHSMSLAEGDADSYYLKGDKKKPWCILVCWLNPLLDTEKRENFLNAWVDEYGQKLNDKLREKFKIETEQEVVFNEKGELNFEWPDVLKDLDLVIATQTRPRLRVRDYSRYATAEELGTAFKKKAEYFEKNIKSGIYTWDDGVIQKKLEN